VPAFFRFVRANALQKQSGHRDLSGRLGKLERALAKVS